MCAFGREEGKGARPMTCTRAVVFLGMRAEALPELLSTPHQLDPTLGARGPEPRGALRRVDQQARERREAPRAVVRVRWRPGRSPRTDPNGRQNSA